MLELVKLRFFDNFFVAVDDNCGGGDDRNLQLERRSFHRH